MQHMENNIYVPSPVSGRKGYSILRRPSLIGSSSSLLKSALVDDFTSEGITYNGGQRRLSTSNHEFGRRSESNGRRNSVAVTIAPHHHHHPHPSSKRNNNPLSSSSISIMSAKYSTINNSNNNYGEDMMQYSPTTKAMYLSKSLGGGGSMMFHDGYLSRSPILIHRERIEHKDKQDQIMVMRDDEAATTTPTTTTPTTTTKKDDTENNHTNTNLKNSGYMMTDNISTKTTDSAYMITDNSSKKMTDSGYMMTDSGYMMTDSCSDVTDNCYADDIEYTDPSDWFLEQEEEEEPMYEIVEREELRDRQRASIDCCASQLNLSPQNAALVLQFFRWDREKLLKEYFDNEEYYLKKAGVIDNTIDKISPRSHCFSSSSSEVCQICLEPKEPAQMFSAGCVHRYCFSCWEEYLTHVGTESGSEIINMCCMFPLCPRKLGFDVFERVASPAIMQRYTYFMLKDYGERQLSTVFCPKSECGNAVIYSGFGRPADVVECHCGTRFCFACENEKHNPVQCKQLEQWMREVRDDKDSIDLIKATSKPCFHCGVFTDRIAGCNHMICRKAQGGCGGEWCWMCRGDWSSHGAHTGGFYSCNKYDESDAKNKDNESQEFIDKTNNSKFLHYYNRYFNHDILMKETSREISSGETEKKMREYSAATSSSSEFLLEAAELLVECRRVLKYTYVYGYYLPDIPSKSLFEYQQASAEGVTERLSELYHATTEVISQSPQVDFVNYIRVTKKYIGNLVKSIEAEG